MSSDSRDIRGGYDILALDTRREGSTFLERNEPPSRFPERLQSEGYDEYFDPPLEDKYECRICLLVLREPVVTLCGHRFCRGCILRSIR